MSTKKEEDFLNSLMIKSIKNIIDNDPLKFIAKRTTCRFSRYKILSQDPIPLEDQKIYRVGTYVDETKK